MSTPTDSAQKELEFNKNRFLSQSTSITCPFCGNNFKVSNRYKLPFEIENLENGLGKIWITTACCDKTYDLGTCILK